MAALPSSKKEVLILGPGGIKGFYILGSIWYFETVNKDFDIYCGVSVGSLIAILKIIGCPIDQIIKSAKETIDEIIADPKVVLKDILTGKGLLPNYLIIEQVNEILIRKYGKVLTFREIKEKTGKELVIVASNLSQSRAQYFSISESPDLEVTVAASLSINIPIIFQRASYQGDIYIDGNLSDPYPIEYFIKQNIKVTIISIECQACLDGMLGYLMNSIDLFVKITRRKLIEQYQDCCHIIISTDKIVFDKIFPDEKEIEKMLSIGFLKTKQVFNIKEQQ